MPPGSRSRGCRTALWIDAEVIPIGPDGRRGRHHARWPQDGAHGPLRGGERVALAGHAFLGVQALVTGGGQAPWSEARKVGRRTKARGHPTSYAGRRDHVPVDHARGCPRMIATYQGRCIVPRTRFSPLAPLRLRLKPLRGFGGVTTRAAAVSITEDKEISERAHRRAACSPRSRRRDGGRGEDARWAVGRHLTNHVFLDSAHHFPSDRIMLAAMALTTERSK